MAVEPRRQHGMILPDGAIAAEHQAQLLAREAGFAERDVFCDCVVLAIALAGRKGGERGGPAVGFAMLGEVADIADRLVDGAVGLIQPVAPGLGLDRIDQAEELRGIGRAGGRILPALREYGLLLRQIGFEAAPFAPQAVLPVRGR
ncbi:hypothetical protein ACVIW0_004813 [Bradyrhizobium sp. USDA 4454]